MRITTVTYERLCSLPGYNNERIGVTMAVGENETAVAAFHAAEAWVNTRLGTTAVPRVNQREAELRKRLEDAHAEVGRLEAELEAYQDGELPF